MSRLEMFDFRYLIPRIPRIISDDPNLYGVSEDCIKEKLIQSEMNPNIIRLSRGDGREKIMNSILPPEILFQWGLKSNHAFQETSWVRDQLEPEVSSREYLRRLLTLLSNSVHHHKVKYQLAGDFNTFLASINTAIENSDDLTSRILLKEFMCFLLHTSGNPEFGGITPWISTSMGRNRLQVGMRFGKSGRHNGYVVFDYWVPIIEKGITFNATYDLILKLRDLGVIWHPDRNSEVMVKYAMFPQKLVGYYYYEGYKIIHYYVNPYYLRQMRENPDFSIGDEINIPQDNVNFTMDTEIPYNLIYQQLGNRLIMFDRN